MSQDDSLASQIDIFVDGTAVPTDTMDNLMEAVVDQHSHLPHMFMLRFYDSAHELIDGSTFGLTKEVEIKGYNSSDTAFSLIKGEITALEPQLNEGMESVLVVRGYDKSHRLFREVKSQAFLNIKDSDLASQIAGNAGLSAQVDSTSTVYDHLFQDNQTDLAFLVGRAWRIGYECFADDGKLYFRKPPTSGTTQRLKWGEGLISFRATESLAEQVDEVQVKGWDAEKLDAIVGKAKKGKLYPSSTAGGEYGKASSFGKGLMIVVDQPVVSQAEADIMAEARINELSGTFLEAEGVAYQEPAVRSGQFVEIEGVGRKFAGKYMVTQATHVYNNDAGLRVTFMARGTRTGLVAEQVNRRPPLQRWTGVVAATVTNTDDPNDWGRVKVQYPWLTDSDESWWARLVSVGAGPEAGLFAVPEVGDEVAVAFEHGDFNRPFVLGGMWNGKHKIPPPGAGAGAGEKPQVRTWHSIKGHYMAMYDNADNKIETMTVAGHHLVMDDANKMVEIKTSGGHTVTMDDQGKKLEITTSGGHTITLDDTARKATITSSGDVEIKAGMNMKIEASGMMDLKASGPVNIKGAVVNIN
jgi:phage protein D